jgi:hypothetical protein
MLKSFFYDKCIALIFIFAFLFWLQGNILVWDIGILDGREIDWQGKILFGIIDSSIWFFFICLAILKSAIISKNVRLLSAVFIFIQLISIFLLGNRVTDDLNFKNYTLDNSKKFSFSKEKNVIILILDGFQSDFFQEIINEHYDFKQVFKDFYFFRNSISGYSYTKFAIPLILTGQYYDNSFTNEEFIKKVYSEKSIPKVLKSNGWQVDLFPYKMNSIYFNKNILSNFKIKQKRSQKYNLIQLNNIFLIRYMPFFFKRFFVKEKYSFHDIKDQKDEILYPHPLFLKNLARQTINQTNKNAKKKTFKFYHIEVPHWPLIYNERLEYEKMEINRENYKKQARAALEIAKTLINKLKELNVYDNSMIFIVGDHGAGNQEQKFILPNGWCCDNEAVVSENFKVAALPLILVKPFHHEENNITTSDAPVSLSDIARTVFSELEIEGEYHGISMFNVSDSVNRSRRFLEYHCHEKNGYQCPMKEYFITGYSWMEKSWKQTDRLFTSKGLKHISSAKSAQLYQYGKTIDFSETGNSFQYLSGKGWGIASYGNTWTYSKKVELVLPVNPPTSDLILKASIIPYLGKGKLRHQKVKVYVNNQFVNEWTVTKSEKYQISIPKRYIKNKQLKLGFQLPDAISPHELKIGVDTKPLGIAFKDLVILEEHIYKFGTKINFGVGGNAIKYVGKGWSFPESWGDGITWTSDNNAYLSFPIDEPKSDLTLKASLIPYLGNGKLDKQRVQIYVNKISVNEWIINAPGEHRIRIPKRYIKDDILKIRFYLPDAISPSQIAESGDNRILALAMHSLKLSEEKYTSFD